MTERCKAFVYGSYTMRCSRDAKKDGYCAQHHPEEKKLRRSIRTEERFVALASEKRVEDLKEQIVEAVRQWRHCRMSHDDILDRLYDLIDELERSK